MSIMSNSFLLVASNGGTFLCFLLFSTVEACFWSYELWKIFTVWFLNFQILIITRWVYCIPELRILVDDIGLFAAYNVRVKWKDEIILRAEEVHVGLEWKLANLRNMSFRLHVKKLLKSIGDSLEALFTFDLYWRILPSFTSTGLEHNQELKDMIKPKLTRLHGTDGRIILRPSREATLSRPSPKLLLKVKAAEAVFIKGIDVFVISVRANKLSSHLKGRIHSHGSKKRDPVINMTCLRLKLVFPKDSPMQLSHRFHGTRVRITRNNLKDVLWSANEFKEIVSDPNSSDDEQQPSESSKSQVPHSNKQISKVRVNIEDFVISIGTRSIPEIAAIKVSLDLTAENWVGKSRCSGSIGIQGVSVSDIHAVDPCIILGNDLITASWRCSFTSTHVYKRCLIMNADSKEFLSVILRPDCFGVLAKLHQDYSFFSKNTEPSSFTQFGETIKLIIKEHCPRTQISSEIEGVNLCLEMDVFEQLAACTLEDIRVQCTQDAENLSLDFTVKDIEVEDRINNVLSVRKLSRDGFHKRSLQATIIQEASTEHRSVSFQQLYGEIVDLNITVEEELLLKLFVFFGITEKKQLWGEEKSEIIKLIFEYTEPSRTGSSQTASNGTQCLSAGEEVSFFFEKLEVSGVGVVISISPNQDLPEELLNLKEQLGIPVGLPPRVENARLDFERFLRTGIYYRSLDGLVRDVKRHYFKEIGRHSAKILGSLHLLGNVTGLKDNIAEGLIELRETGDYMGFARNVRSGLTDSYYKLTDSWSAYVKPTPRKTLTKPKEDKIEEQVNKEYVEAGLLSSITSGLGGWLFSPTEETSGPSQATNTTTKLAPSNIQSPAFYSLSQRDKRSMCSQEHDVPSDELSCRIFERDALHRCNAYQRDVSTEVQPPNGTPQRDLNVQQTRDTKQHEEPSNSRRPSCSSARDNSSDISHSISASEQCVSNDADMRDEWCIVPEEDIQSTCASMSSFSAPTGWELVPRELQKKLKGQEFLRRLKQSINNDENMEEKFLCCLKLRYADPNNKLNALLTTSKVYFMKVGSSSRDNIVLEIDLNKLYKTQEKNQDGKDYLELLMRMNGMQRLCLPSPDAEDNPLVLCDSLQLAAKAANKINNARKRYSDESCPCQVILNTVLSR